VRSTVISVSADDLRRLLREQPDLAHSLIAMLSSALREERGTVPSRRPEAIDERFRVAFFDTKPYDRAGFEPLLGRDLAATWLPSRLDARTAELSTGHHAVCAFVNDDLSAPTLETLARLGVGLIAMRCAGYNNVDVAVAASLGLQVARVPAYSPHAVAEHTLALILTLNRKTHRAYNRVREGNFSLEGLVGSDLYGQCAGIVGLGQIGRCCAEIFRGLGMRVLACDVAPDREFAARTGVSLVELDELLESSDVITLHSPLLPTTRHLIDARRIACMKRGVMLINTSRGALIDTPALINGLKSGQIGSAGLDVYEEEGDYFFEDHSAHVITDDVLARLMTFSNVLITSHQAFLTEQALHNIAQTTVGNVRQYAAGQVLANGVSTG
jgi:D-lactate dehydrogenase